MAIKWAELQERYDVLSVELSVPELESSKRYQLQKEHSYLANLLSKHKEIERLDQHLTQTQEQATSNQESDLAELFAQELTVLRTRRQEAQEELEALLYPPDPLDDRSVFVEIRAGTGGQEAALFAGDLTRMYTAYALTKQWKVSLVSASQTDLKGFREVIVHIEGKQVYGHLKFESGVHRVQRVPQTETSGRIHTSTATVAVLPEAEEVEYSISPNDLRIDVFRSGGAGGQHVNTTDSAVRITHIPTGLVVSCQDERSQHKNKAKAMKVLQSRLLALHQEKQEREMSKKRKELVGTGERAEKVRTYNFPQNRVTDHQADITLKTLDRFIEGAIDEVIQALRYKEKAERQQKSFGPA
jgi:peptide chain release factor 1